MGFAIIVLYLVTAFLSPAALFGPLANFHVELILAVLAFVVSFPKLQSSFIFKTPQTLALVGLGFAVILSVLIGAQWPGGAVSAFLSFIPHGFAYFLVCLHCKSKREFKILILMLLFVCLFVIAHGTIDIFRGLPANGPPISASGDFDRDMWNSDHPYIFAMSTDTGWIYRLKGLGIIDDPNDCGQLIVCVIPLVFIFWQAKRTGRNIAIVIAPVAVLLWGLFQTHSRGALVALLAVSVVAMRRRIGTLPALMLAGGLFAAAMALQFTGGRSLSASAGEDRTELWGDSFEVLRSHPIFGVGFGNLADYIGHTAHNSVAVCAAELGMFGLFFWSLFLYPTMRDAIVIASPLQDGQGAPVNETSAVAPLAEVEIEAIDKKEINTFGYLLILSLVGYLAAGWFLSRAFVLTFYLLGGMVEVVFEMARRQGMIGPRLRLERAMVYSAGLVVALVLALYAMLRVLNAMH